MKTANLREILATRSRATFAHRINFDRVGYDTLPKMKEWCESNCTGLWRNEQCMPYISNLKMIMMLQCLCYVGAVQKGIS